MKLRHKTSLEDQVQEKIQYAEGAPGLYKILWRHSMNDLSYKPRSACVRALCRGVGDIRARITHRIYTVGPNTWKMEWREVRR